MTTKHTLLSFVSAVAMAASAQAATVVPVIAYGHNNRDNFGGNITDIYNGSGMNGFNYPGSGPDTNQPPGWPTGYGEVNTWTRTSTQYRDEWQADQLLDRNTSLNSKVGWVIMDLGSSIAGLDQMYLWNGQQIGTSALKDFNLYYSNGSPTIPLTQGPTSGTAADDYNFANAAWTKVNTSGLLTVADNADATAQGIYALGGVTARYVAIEMMSRWSGNFDPNTGRIGFAEVGFSYTGVPEPSAALLGSLGALALLRRRR